MSKVMSAVVGHCHRILDTCGRRSARGTGISPLAALFLADYDKLNE